LKHRADNRHPAQGTSGSGDTKCSNESPRRWNESAPPERNESGFTLVELLIVIVIVILGVLAGIVVFSVAGVTSRGAVAACKADVASVTVASEAYYAQSTPRLRHRDRWRCRHHAPGFRAA
jgi:type II secretory pathway pseudopilin PulG